MEKAPSEKQKKYLQYLIEKTLKENAPAVEKAKRVCREDKGFLQYYLRALTKYAFARKVKKMLENGELDRKKASYAISLLKSWTWPSIPIGVNTYVDGEKVFGRINVLEVIK